MATPELIQTLKISALTMKLLKFIPILTIIVFSSCNMDPGYTAYSNVVIPFD